MAAHARAASPPAAPAGQKANPHTRHTTRFRGITYRTKADGTRTYYVHAAGRYHRAGATEKEALTLQASLRGKLARGERVGDTVTFAALAEEWLASKHRLRPWTHKSYRAALDNVLLPRFATLPVRKLTPDRIATLVRELEGRGLAGSYIQNLLKPLNGTLTLALRRGVIGANPCSLLTSDERPKPKRAERRIWSPADIQALLAASARLAAQPTSRYDYSLLLRTALYTGLRLGELLGLRWCDLDLGEGTIQVRHQWTREGTLAEPKTAKGKRPVPLAPTLAALLKAHKLASPHSHEHDFVFSSHTGGALAHRNVVRRGFHPAVTLARLNTDGQPKVTFHDLRHAFASIMIERGITATVLADLMGHENSTTTERTYIHLFNRVRTDAQVRAAMESAIRLP
jgi:integrase